MFRCCLKIDWFDLILKFFGQLSDFWPEATRRSSSEYILYQICPSVSRIGVQWSRGHNIRPIETILVWNEEWQRQGGRLADSFAGILSLYAVLILSVFRWYINITHCLNLNVLWDFGASKLGGKREIDARPLIDGLSNRSLQLYNECAYMVLQFCI